MRISIEYGQLEKFNVKIHGFIGRFKQADRALAAEAAQKTYEKIVHYASRRPGPQIVTGRYVNSWMVSGGGVFGVGYLIYTNAEYAKRLEYGFAGTDSLGRNYNQPPFPHVRPAVAEMTPWYAERLGKLPKEVWEG